MSVYRRADGIYVYDFWLKRVRFYGTTGAKSKRAAEDIEQARRDEARQTLTKIKEQRTGPMTVNVAFDRFWAEVGDTYTGTYRKTVWTALKWMMEALGANTLLRDIGPNKVTEVIARRRGENVTNATVNRTVTELLRRIQRRAGRHWEQEVQPIEWSDMLLPEPKERIRELRDHEETRLVAAMRQDYLPAVQFAIASGLRRAEIVGLTWAAVDWTAKTISVVGKGDKADTIPLSGRMRAIIAPLRGHHPRAVFTYVAQATRRQAGVPYRIRGLRYPITMEGFKTAWRRFGGAAAGLEDFRFHDTRHTVASRLLRETGNLKLVQKLLRHEDIATTAKYAHADDEDLRGAMESLEKSRRKSRKGGRDTA